MLDSLSFQKSCVCCHVGTRQGCLVSSCLVLTRQGCHVGTRQGTLSLRCLAKHAAGMVSPGTLPRPSLRGPHAPRSSDRVRGQVLVPQSPPSPCLAERPSHLYLHLLSQQQRLHLPNSNVSASRPSLLDNSSFTVCQNAPSSGARDKPGLTEMVGSSGSMPRGPARGPSSGSPLRVPAQGSRLIYLVVLYLSLTMTPNWPSALMGGVGAARYGLAGGAGRSVAVWDQGSWCSATTSHLQRGSCHCQYRGTL